MQLKTITARIDEGDLVPASITVYQSDGVTQAPAVYDGNGNSLSNPFTLTKKGVQSIRLPDGEYVFTTTTVNGTSTQRSHFYDADEKDPTFMLKDPNTGVYTALHIGGEPYEPVVQNGLVLCDYANGNYQLIALHQPGIVISTANVPKGGQLLIEIINGDLLPPNINALYPLQAELDELVFTHMTTLVIDRDGEGEQQLRRGRSWAKEINLAVGNTAVVADHQILHTFKIDTPANATSFGSILITAAYYMRSSNSDGYIGIFSGGHTGDYYNTVSTMYYVKFAMPADATVWGDLTLKRFGGGFSFGNEAAGYVAGGNNLDVLLSSIEKLTYVTGSGGVSYGNLITPRAIGASCSSNYRGLIAGGYNWVNAAVNLNDIEYFDYEVDTQAMGFGTLATPRRWSTGTSDDTYGLIGSGYDGAGWIFETELAAIHIPGNSYHFGNLSLDRQGAAACTDGEYAVFSGGVRSGTRSNVIDYVLIPYEATASDFGNLLSNVDQTSASSGD